MAEFPQYSEDGEEILYFPNVWREISPQEILGADCFLPFAPINNGMNRFVLDITGVDFRKMLSALYLGSEIAYPQEFMQIVTNFLKMVHCPVDFEEECATYPPYTPIIQYSPQNPFNDPNAVPDGYLLPPFVVVDASNIGEFPQNEIGDVVVVAGSFTLDVNWFETLDGQLPTFTIQVEGAGTVNIQFLDQVQGGLVVITVDNPPDLADIIAGIVTGADNIIDLNMDILSLPPETAIEHIFPVQVEGAGLHTIYAVFLPILDDSLIPLRFGGGLRSIELCEFGEIPMAYVEDVRINTEDYDSPTLEKRISGVWSMVGNWPDLLSLISDAYSLAVSAFEQGVLALEENADQDLAIAALDERVDYLEIEMENQIVRINGLEDRTDELDERVDVLEAWKPTVDARLDALEAWDASEAVWSEEFDFTTGQHGWSGTFYQAGEGFLYSVGNTQNTLAGVVIYDNRVSFIEAHFKKSTGTGFVLATVQWPNGFNTQSIRLPQNVNDTSIQWIQANPINGQYSPDLEIIFSGAHSYYLTKLVIWGRGENPF